MGLYGRVDLTQYIVVSIWFGCNNHCAICMLSDLKNQLPPIGFEGFQKLVLDIVRDGRFRNLILSGAEVTTHEDLGRYVQFAVSQRWFHKIQIQTNGRRLSDEKYLEHLVETGVNEFFISVQGLEESHEAVTRIPGSFRQTITAIENLRSYPVNVITNTVLTRFNIDDVLPLLSLLSQTDASEMHIWNFFPMERNDRQDLLVSMGDFTRILPELVKTAKAARKALVFKSFPDCLSVGKPGFFDSLFPVTVLPDLFWRRFQENIFGLCYYRARGECSSRSCAGLSAAHIQKYGEERNLLRPMASGESEPVKE